MALRPPGRGELGARNSRNSGMHQGMIVVTGVPPSCRYPLFRADTVALHVLLLGCCFTLLLPSTIEATTCAAISSGDCDTCQECCRIYLAGPNRTQVRVFLLMSLNKAAFTCIYGRALHIGYGCRCAMIAYKWSATPPRQQRVCIGCPTLHNPAHMDALIAAGGSHGHHACAIVRFVMMGGLYSSLSCCRTSVAVWSSNY